jgi:ABC-type nickel/cobalt efflux system permease component RcnA
LSHSASPFLCWVFLRWGLSKLRETEAQSGGGSPIPMVSRETEALPGREHLFLLCAYTHTHTHTHTHRHTHTQTHTHTHTHTQSQEPGRLGLDPGTNQ